MKLRRRYGTPLALAITLALIVKALILYGLWHAFFSAPQVKHMRMPTAKVEQHLLPPAQPPSNTSPRK
nr:cytochrome oxidase putative small subunit CydP [uncultured Duganella sp.]